MQKRSVARPLIVRAAITAEGPGAVVTARPACGDRRDDAAARVADPGRAGVADHDDELTGSNPLDDLATERRLVVLVQGRAVDRAPRCRWR